MHWRHCHYFTHLLLPPRRHPWCGIQPIPLLFVSTLWRAMTAMTPYRTSTLMNYRTSQLADSHPCPTHSTPCLSSYLPASTPFAIYEHPPDRGGKLRQSCG